MVDACIDVFKERVQKRSAEVQPLDLSALQIEIQTLRVDLRASLAAPVTLLKETSLVPVLNLFAPNEPTDSSLRKRPCMDEDPQDRHVHAKRAEEQDFEQALRESRHEVEIR